MIEVGNIIDGEAGNCFWNVLADRMSERALSLSLRLKWMYVVGNNRYIKRNPVHILSANLYYKLMFNKNFLNSYAMLM
jgi:hypothetical protein